MGRADRSGAGNGVVFPEDRQRKEEKEENKDQGCDRVCLFSWLIASKKHSETNQIRHEGQMIDPHRRLVDRGSILKRHNHDRCWIAEKVVVVLLPKPKRMIGAG